MRFLRFFRYLLQLLYFIDDTEELVLQLNVPFYIIYDNKIIRLRVEKFSKSFIFFPTFFVLNFVFLYFIQYNFIYFIKIIFQNSQLFFYKCKRNYRNLSKTINYEIKWVFIKLILINPNTGMETPKSRSEIQRDNF